MQKSQYKGEPRDKVYRLKSSKTPESVILRGSSSKRETLLHVDKETNTQREIRYATNESSPYVDEQSQYARMSHIIFEQGMLRVPAHNVALQWFLEVHPKFGVDYELVDEAKSAEKELDILELRIEAQTKALELDIEKIMLIAPVLLTNLNGSVNNYSPSQIKLKVLQKAHDDPKKFLSAISDTSIEFESQVKKFFDLNLLSTRNNDKEIYFNLPDSKKRMTILKEGTDPIIGAMSYFKTDEGQSALKALELELEAIEEL